RDADERRHRLHRGEEVLCGLDGLPVPLRQIGAHAVAELRIGIETRPRRGATDAELAELRASRAKTRGRAADALGPAGKLLTERDWHRVLQMRAARFHGVGIARRFLG